MEEPVNIPINLTTDLVNGLYEGCYYDGEKLYNTQDLNLEELRFIKSSIETYADEIHDILKFMVDYGEDMTSNSIEIMNEDYSKTPKEFVESTKLIKDINKCLYNK